MWVFVLDTFEMRPKRAKQQGFWKTMLLTGTLIHPLFLLGLWYLDAAHPGLIATVWNLMFVAFLIGLLEMVILGETVDRFIGSDATQDGTGPPASQ